jgi:hypothetical protein
VEAPNKQSQDYTWKFKNGATFCGLEVAYNDNRVNHNARPTHETSTRGDYFDPYPLDYHKGIELVQIYIRPPRHK